MRKPEGMPLYSWLVEGLSLKNVIITVFIVVGLHYTQDSRITVVEQHEPEFARRLDETQKAIDAQTNDIKSKVDRDTYDADQRKLQEELSEIQDSEGRIETILMDQKKR